MPKTETLFTTTRRRLLAGGAAAFALPQLAFAQAAYPAKTVTFVCAFQAGAGADILVRYFASKFQELTGQTVIVENRPGAQANIAAEHTARAAADGHTLLVHAGTSIAGNVHLLKEPPLHPATDLRTIATTHDQSFLVAVAADSPYQGLQDLIADQKTKGDAGSYAYSATSGFVLAEELKMMAGLATEPVRYGAGIETINDILAGHVDFGVLDPATALARVATGEMRIIGVASAERMPGMPEVPTFREQGIDLVQGGWWGVMAPKDLPDDLAETINGLFNSLLDTEETRRFIADQGGVILLSTPQEAQQLMVDTVDEWQRLVTLIGIAPQ